MYERRKSLFFIILLLSTMGGIIHDCRCSTGERNEEKPCGKSVGNYVIAFFGHILPTAKARWLTKGSEDADFRLVYFERKKQIPSWTFFSGPNDIIQIALDTKKLKSKSHRIFKTKARRLTVSLGLNSSLTLSVDKLYMTGRSPNQKNDTSAIAVLKWL